MLTNESRPTVMEIGISAYMDMMVVESGEEMSWVLIQLHTSNYISFSSLTVYGVDG